MLKDILVSDVRINILQLMLPTPEEQYHVRAIVRAVNAEINAVRRELIKLEEMGLFKKRQSGNRIYYTVDTSHTYYSDLLGFVCKDIGVGGLFLKNIKQLGKVKYAAVSKSFLRKRKSTILDVDLFVVGDVNLEVLKRIVASAERTENREINYTTMTEQDFLFRKRKNDHFVMKMLSQGRSMLVGDEEEFCNLS